MIFAAMDTPRGIYPPAIQKALDYLESQDIMNMEPGRYPIEGDRMFAVVVDVNLAEAQQIRPEAHRTYIDIQYWPQSPTRFGCFPLTGRSQVTESNPAGDVWYYQPEGDEAFLYGRPGSFAVFFPWDVHRPDIQVSGPQRIRKCVVKVDMCLMG